jgi:hypothetical protein
MANGDITSIEELGRFTIPGAGHDLQGLAKNNKVLVWGRLTGSYVTTGINLANEGGILALGVSVADTVNLTVTAVNATYPTDNKLFLANLDSSNKIFVVDEMGQANPAVPGDGHVVVIDYFVIGEDEARSPELV